MARGYRYVDAVRLLGGNDPLITSLDTVMGAATLGALPVMELIEAKNELVKLGGELLRRWRGRKAEADWSSRTEQLEAAHTILVVSAFFAALDTLDLPFRVEDLAMTRDEQDAIRDTLDSPPPTPSPERPFERLKADLRAYYENLGEEVRVFLRGLAIWDDLAEHERERVFAQFGEVLAERAVKRYEDDYRRLMQDVPEFAYWAGMIDHAATRAGLGSLERLLSAVTSGRALPVQLEALASAQRALLRRPVAETGDVPSGMRLPTLEEAYVTPRFRVARVDEQANPSVDDWWSGTEIRADLPEFLAGYLTAPEAAEIPLVVLGQPGAGKSVLTKVLAAHLPADFLPVRVPLRDVSASGDLQKQIEDAVYRTTAERITWPELARSAAGALPVVLLDGFDELLQATGLRQSDYLERVVEFQRREREVGRSVAVVVTSRTAVADRARMPEGTLALRLEPFDEDQISRWLDVWNTANAAYFNRSGVHPLTLDLVRKHPQLAEQPLLLMMLALYDAQGNALRHTLAELGEAELYERLIRAFAERELEKEYPRDRVPELVENELLVLSVVAFAMFNRRRQWASAHEVTGDLNAMIPRQHDPAGLHTPLTAGERAFGRFFFVHRSQAVRDSDTVHTYEFLHATFGEFLIARLIASLLREMADTKPGIFGAEDDDTRLRTLLSWAVLPTRWPIISFLQEMIGALSEEERENLCRLVIRLFRGLDIRPDSSLPTYRPWVAGPPRRYAYYSANLMLLALTCSGTLYASELLPVREDTVTEWRRMAGLWRSQCDAEEWESVVDAVEVIQQWREGKQEIKLRLSPDPWTASPVDVRWVMASSQGNVRKRWEDDVKRQARFSCMFNETLLIYALEPVLESHKKLNFTMAPPFLARYFLAILFSTFNDPEKRALVYEQLMNRLFFRIPEAVHKALIGDLLTLDDATFTQVVEALDARLEKSDQAMLSELKRLRAITGQISWSPQPSANDSHI